MIVLAGASVVLPDRVMDDATVVIDGDRIVEVSRGAPAASARSLRGHFILPGFVDLHVHGVAGIDVFDGDEAVRAMARAMPRFGVTAFAPTSIACGPDRLGRLLHAVRRARSGPEPGAARVLPAHLESNFVSPEWAGAQPLSCLRSPRRPAKPAGSAGDFSADDILAVIDRWRSDVGVATLAPELDGGDELVRWLLDRGIRISLGHSGATFEQATAAIDAGATRATHLFNRMRPMSHRDPGLVGAVLARDEIATEIVCDGCHVHPAVVRLAIAAKTPSRVMAITDGTAGSGLPEGSSATLGGLPITVRDTARLDDGTMAGSVLTMDRAYRFLTSAVSLNPVEAAHVCASTPARHAGLQELGAIAPGFVADLVVLDASLAVAKTYVGGVQVYSRTPA